MSALAQRAQQLASEQGRAASEQAERCAARVQALLEGQLAEVRGGVEQLLRCKAEVSDINQFTGAPLGAGCAGLLAAGGGQGSLVPAPSSAVEEARAASVPC
jgi:hypothetical protein